MVTTVTIHSKYPIISHDLSYRSLSNVLRVDQVVEADNDKAALVNF